MVFYIYLHADFLGQEKWGQEEDILLRNAERGGGGGVASGWLVPSCPGGNAVGFSSQPVLNLDKNCGEGGEFSCWALSSLLKVLINIWLRVGSILSCQTFPCGQPFGDCLGIGLMGISWPGQTSGNSSFSGGRGWSSPLPDGSCLNLGHFRSNLDWISS